MLVRDVSSRVGNPFVSLDYVLSSCKTYSYSVAEIFGEKVKVDTYRNLYYYDGLEFDGHEIDRLAKYIIAKKEQRAMTGISETQDNLVGGLSQFRNSFPEKIQQPTQPPVLNEKPSKSSKKLKDLIAYYYKR